MSEANPPSPVGVTMDDGKLTVMDSKGRRLVVKRLDALAELDLIEAAGGANAENRRWMTMATLAACVSDIDGVPRPFPTTKAMVRNQVGIVGSEGIKAVVDALAPEQAETVASEADTVATAKN